MSFKSKRPKTRIAVAKIRFIKIERDFGKNFSQPSNNFSLGFIGKPERVWVHTCTFVPLLALLGLACSSGSEMNCEQLLVPLRSIKQLSLQLANVALHAKTLGRSEEIRTTAAVVVHYYGGHLLANY